MARILFILILIGSCATKPTPYQKEKKKEGYSDSSYEKIHVAVFRANTKTRPSRAELYAKFRAIEFCQTTEQKHANIIDVRDKTQEKEITRTTGSGWGPTYGFGMYPYYNRYSSFGVGATFSTISTDSWREKVLYPMVEVFYTCADQMFRPELLIKEISAEQMKLLVKDLKGALQVEKVFDGSPNKSKIEIGDIILKVNGKRIEKVYELIPLFNQPGSLVLVEFLREGERRTEKLESKDVTENFLRAEKEIIDMVCSNKNEKNQNILKHRCQ